MTDQTARDRLIAYATTTRTVTVDGLDPLLDAVLAEAAVPSAVPAPTTARAGLREQIAEALAAVDGWKWAPGFKASSPTWHGYQNRADAVLAVLPATVDRAGDEAPAATCSAQHRKFDDGRLCIRAAQHHGDHIDERGYHWSDTVAVYPLADGTFRTGINARAELRRLAVEARDGHTTQDEAPCSTADKAAAQNLTPTEYRARSHQAAMDTIRTALPNLYAHVALRVEDALAPQLPTHTVNEEG